MTSNINPNQPSPTTPSKIITPPGLTEAQTPTIQKPPFDQLNEKNDLIHFISSHNGDAATYLTKIWGEKLDPIIQEKITKFESEWKDLADKLRNGTSWKDLKTEFKDSDEKLDRLDKFRSAAIALIKDCVNYRLESSYGLPKIQSWGGVGTPGVQSDVDLSLSEFYTEGGQTKSLPLSEEDLMLAKGLFESLWTKVFNGLSGEQADTEVYVRHNGSFSTNNDLQTEEGKRTFQTIEQLAVALTAYKNYTNAGTDPTNKKWVDYKNLSLEAAGESKDHVSQLLNTAKNLTDKQTYGCNTHIIGLYAQNHPEINDQLKEIQEMPKEEQQKRMHELIKDLKKDPEAKHELELNAYYYYQPFLMDFSNKLTTIQQKVNRLTKNLADIIGDTSHTEVEIDQLRNEFVLYSVLRVTCFPEGYYTEGAFKRVVEHAGGQRETRKTERMLGLFTEYGIGKAVTGFAESNMMDHIESGMENFALWMNKVFIKDQKSQDLTTDPQHIVDSSKYGERFIHDDLEILKKSRRHDLKEIKKLIQSITEDNIDNTSPSLEPTRKQLMAALKEIKKLSDTSRENPPTKDEIETSWQKFNDTFQTFLFHIQSTTEASEESAVLEDIKILKLKKLIKNTKNKDVELIPLLSQVAQEKKLINEMLMAKRETVIPSENIPQLIKKELEGEQVRMKNIQDSLSSYIKTLTLPEADSQSLFLNTPTEFVDSIANKILETLKGQYDLQNGEIEELKNILKIEVEEILNETLQMNSFQMLRFLPISALFKSSRKNQSMRNEVLKIKLMDYIKRQYPIIHNIDSKIEKTIMPIIKYVSESEKYKDVDPESKYRSLNLALSKRNIWAVDKDKNPLNPHIQETFSIVFNVKIPKPASKAQFRKIIKTESKRISLSKIPNPQEFVKKLKNLHEQTMAYIYKNNLITLNLENPLFSNLEEKWSRQTA